MSFVSEGHIHDLSRRVPPDRRPANDLVFAVAPTRLLEFLLIEDSDSLELRRKDIECELASRREVPAHRPKAGELILDCQEVLEGPECGIDEGKALRSEVEVLHGAWHQPQVFRRRLARKLFEHRVGAVQTRAGDPVASDREKDSAAAASELEHRAPGLLRQPPVELHVTGRSPKGLEGAVAMPRARRAVGVRVPHGARILRARIQRQWRFPRKATSSSVMWPSTDPSAWARRLWSSSWPGYFTGHRFWRMWTIRFCPTSTRRRPVRPFKPSSSSCSPATSSSGRSRRSTSFPTSSSPTTTSPRTRSS